MPHRFSPARGTARLTPLFWGILMRARIFSRVPGLATLVAALLVVATLPASAEKRIALVVGNSAYKNIAPLDNPSKDASLMAETLGLLGFTLVGGGARGGLVHGARGRVAV